MIITEKKFYIELDGGNIRFFLQDMMGGNVSYTARIQEACLFSEREKAENALYKVQLAGIKNQMTVKQMKVTYQL